MNSLIKLLAKLAVLKKDLDYHVVRASMVIIFLFFGYQKWFDYEAQTLIPYISHGPLIFWMYPVFGIKGASWFLGVSEWLFAALLFAGFWNKKLGVLGALGAVASFVSTITIIPFHAEWLGCLGWRLSRDDRKHSLPHEGCRPSCRVFLFAQAGRCQSHNYQQALPEPGRGRADRPRDGTLSLGWARSQIEAFQRATREKIGGSDGT